MKKSYLLIAAAGLIMAACSQEDDFVAQNAAAVEQGDGAVLFDTYLSNTSTRAGQTGAMTTKTLQETGFGVIAFQHSLTNGFETDKASLSPNFMWNQYVGYEASNWVYSPLKYWPNETAKDDKTSNTATSTDKEGVSFFAYAPYIAETASTQETKGGIKFRTFEGTATSGIMSLTENDAKGDPYVHYKIAANSKPSESVDLLWATSSGFAYHPVNADYTNMTTAGEPVINMMKPNVDEKIKFDFKHALARIGVKVVGAFDQAAQGGSLDQFTRVTIKSVSVKGKFQSEGYLNLNNTGHANVAQWYKEGTGEFVAMTASESDVTFSVSSADTETEINPDLKYSGTAGLFPAGVMGVNGSEQYLTTIGTKKYSKVHFDAFHPVDGTTYYSDAAGTLANPAYDTSKKFYSFSPAVGYANVASPAVDGTPYYTIELATGATATTGSSLTAEQKEAKRWYKVVSSVYTYDASPAGATEYYSEDQLVATSAISGYAGGSAPTGDYYTLDPAPGYFMVIPTPLGSGVKDMPVEVTIDYFVTTVDPKLKNGTYNTSEVENVIKQTVDLKDFTNGKSYLLKLILGLTSVKIEAEVSNWEVGTVESNLPQNLE